MMVLQFSFDAPEPNEYHDGHYGMFTMICPTKCFPKSKLSKDKTLYRYTVLMESDSDCLMVIKKILNHYFGYQIKKINRGELIALIQNKPLTSIVLEEQNLFAVLIEKFNWETDVYEKLEKGNNQGSF
jgi:hypothetical protein